MVKKTDKKPTKKSTRVAAKTSKKSNKVDYYPNRMTVAISAAAAVCLTLFAVLATSNSI